MSLGKYLSILAICALISWVSVLLVIFLINPFESGIGGVLFFYMTLMLAGVATVSLLGVTIRAIFVHEISAAKEVKTALRQAVILTLILIFALFLQSQRYLTWWNMLILLGMALIMETIFSSMKKQNI